MPPTEAACFSLLGGPTSVPADTFVGIVLHQSFAQFSRPLSGADVAFSAQLVPPPLSGLFARPLAVSQPADAALNRLVSIPASYLTHAGTFEVDVRLNDVPVGNSPLVFTVQASVVDPRASYCTYAPPAPRAPAQLLPGDAAAVSLVLSDPFGNTVDPTTLPQGQVQVLFAFASGARVAGPVLAAPRGGVSSVPVPRSLDAINATCWVAGQPLPTQPAGGVLPFATLATIAPAAVDGNASIQASAHEGGGIPLDGGSAVIVAGSPQVIVVKAADSLGNTAATDVGMVATLIVLSSPSSASASAAAPAAGVRAASQNQSSAAATVSSGPRVLAVGVWNSTLAGYVISYHLDTAGNYSLQLSAQPPSGPRATVSWAAEVVPAAADAANSLLVAAPDATAGRPGSVAFLVRDRFGNALSGMALGPRPTFGVALADSEDALASVSEPAVPSWNGTHLIGTFQISRAGTYRVILTADGNPVEPLMTSPGVARYVVVRGGAPGGASSSAHGDGLVAATVGEPAQFAIAAMDSQGNRVRPADGATVGVSVVLSPFLLPGAQLVPIAASVVFDPARGEFIVTYTPTAAGQLTISVSVGGQPVACSPFQLNATAGPADSLASTLAGGGTVGGVVGMPMRITVIARDANGVRRTTGGDSVRAALSVVGQAAVPLAPTDNGDGTYTFTATPVAQGQGVVAVLLNGEPLSAGCPRTTQRTATAPPACLVTIYPAPHAQTLDVSRTAVEGPGVAAGVASASSSGVFLLRLFDIFGVQWYSPAPVVRVSLNGSETGVTVENQADGSVLVRYASRVAGEFQLAVRFPSFLRARARTYIAQRSAALTLWKRTLSILFSAAAH